MVIKHPCAVCKKAVGVRHKAIHCDICLKWVHIKCNRISNKTYELIKNNNSNWYCMQCLETEVPYAKINDIEFLETLNKTEIKNVTHSTNHKSSEAIFQEIIDVSGQEQCKYYNPEELNDIDYSKENDISYMHLNIASLPYHFEELESFLANTKIKFDIQ